MTVAASIGALGNYDGTKVTAIVTEVFDQLSLFAGETIAENDDEDWDRIAVQYGVYLMDRLATQERANANPGITIPPLMNEEIRQLINNMQLEPDDPDAMFEGSYSPSNRTFTTSKDNTYYSPGG